MLSLSQLLSLAEFKFWLVSALLLHFSVIRDFRGFWIRNVHRKTLLKLVFSKDPFLLLLFFCRISINNIPEHRICNIAIYADDTTLL